MVRAAGSNRHGSILPTDFHTCRDFRRHPLQDEPFHECLGSGLSLRRIWIAIQTLDAARLVSTPSPSMKIWGLARDRPRVWTP